MKWTKKQTRRQKSGITTSSLPDIIFMLLFFFVAIGMVPAPLAKIDSEQIILDGGEELEDTKNYIHVYIGSEDGELVAQVGYGTAIPLETLTDVIKDVRKEDAQRNTVVLRIDVDTPIGVVRNIIEPAILDANVKKIIYFLDDEEVQN